MVERSISVNGIPIRLTDERWTHITENHAELAGRRPTVLEAISAPNRVLTGNLGELLAVKDIGEGKYLVVVYKETGSNDGFVVTAFLTRRAESLNRKEQVWPIH